MGRAERGRGRVLALALVLVIGGSASWLVGPLLSRPPESAEALSATGAISRSTSTGRPVEKAPAAASGTKAEPGASAAPASVEAHLWLSPPKDGYVWPLAKAKITTYFAPSASGSMVLNGKTIHNGLDLARPCGTPVGAAHAGTVVYAGRKADPYLGFNGSVQLYYDMLAKRKVGNWALAIMVVVDDGNGLVSVYVHLARAAVAAGQAVRAGETIGFVGATGFATGCHLHYSIFVADGPWVPVAPSLVEKWHYPDWMRLRVDPLLVLPPDSPDAAYAVRGLAPPREPPHYVPPSVSLGQRPEAQPADPY